MQVEATDWSLEGRPCRIWIVEDQVSVSQLVQDYVSQLPGFVIVGNSITDTPALAACDNNEVDILILDLMFAGSGGMRLLQRLSHLSNRLRVLVYSATATEHSLRLAIGAGAFGYVAKCDEIGELKTALQRIRAGGVHFSKRPSEVLASLLKQDVARTSELEPLELRLLELLSSGLSIKEAAFSLKLSVQKAYRVQKLIMDRLRGENSRNIERYVVEIGLLGSQNIHSAS